VTRAHSGGIERPSVTNVGYKPTFGDHPLSVETFLLNFDGEVPEASLTISYLHRLRDEIKFQNPAMLKLQIQEDIRRSLKFFRLLDRFRGRD
jgi:riboflavin kinase/FMN adenylyltransferase